MSDPKLILTDSIHIEKLVASGWNKVMKSPTFKPEVANYYFMAEWDEASGKLLISTWEKYGNAHNAHGTTEHAMTLQHAVEVAHNARNEWKKGKRN